MVEVLLVLKQLFDELLRDGKMNIEEFEALIKECQKEEELREIEKIEDKKKQREAAEKLVNELYIYKSAKEVSTTRQDYLQSNIS